MRGEILHYDVTQGIGFITADDGNRYMFSRGDLMQAQRVGKGTRIDFQPDGQNARQVYIADPRGPAQAGSVPQVGTPPVQPPAGAPAQPQQPWTQPGAGAPPPQQPQYQQPYQQTGAPQYAPPVSYGNGVPERNVWESFVYCCTGGYANFRDRARRTEYWGFILFYILALFAAGIVGAIIDTALGLMNDTGPVFTGILVGVLMLGMIVPSLAVNVRRFHDVGLSGWLYVLFIVLSVVYIGSIIIFVISVLPSQKHDNKWGPIPGGVRF